MPFEFAIPLGADCVIHTGSQSSPEDYHKVLWLSYKKTTQWKFVRCTLSPHSNVRESERQQMWSACNTKREQQ